MTMGRRVVGIVVVFVLVSSLIMGPMARPAAGNSCADWSARSIQHHDGQIWILQSGASQGEAAIYQYTGDLESVDTHALGDGIAQVEPNVSRWGIRFTGIYPARDGWWALAEDGLVVRYDDEWQFTGEYHRIDGYSNYELARVNDGWVVLDRNGLVYYDDSWSRITRLQSNHRIGFPSLGLAVRNDQVLVSDSSGGMGTNGHVHRFETVGSGNDLSLEYRDSRNLDWEVSRMYDIVSSDDGGWLTVEDDGGVARYTGYWQFTGEKTEVTDAIGYCGITMAPAIFGVMYIFVGFVSVAGVGTAVWYGRSTSANVPIMTGTTAISWAFSIAYGFFFLPDPLSVLYYVPDAVLATLLVGGTVSTIGVVRASSEYRTVEISAFRWYEAMRRDRRKTIRTGLLVCLAHLPSLVLAWAVL